MNMPKKNIILLLLFLLFCGVVLFLLAQEHIAKKSNQCVPAKGLAYYYGPQLTDVSPRSLVIAFDIHDVILNRDWGSIFNYILHLPHKREAFKLVGKPSFMREIKKIVHKTRVGDYIFDQLLEYNPNFTIFKQDFINLENMQRPNNRVIESIKQLKSRGYKLFILSNIGPRAYKALQEKFADIFNLFDGVYLPDLKANYISKPDVRFYRAFLEYLKKMGYSRYSVLFVDDNLANIRGAERADIAGIHFKSAAQLKVILKDLCVL